MPKEKFPVTPAIRFLRGAGIAFEPYLYNYEERGGTAASARALGVSEHQVVKTLIMEDENRNPLIALMHGDAEVSTKNLARTLGVKSVLPCAPATADRHSGYQVGGTSPFGTRKQMPVFIQETILELEHIYINGGKRGFLVKMKPEDVARVLSARALSMRA